MALYELTEFLRLSAVLNYQLSARPLDLDNVLIVILGKKTLPERDSLILKNFIDYLEKVYGQKRRKMGPPAILHPLRAASLLARAIEQPSMLNLVAELLHDNIEDINPEDFAAEDWSRLDELFHACMEPLPETDRWFLMERLRWLTKRSDETYYSYIGRLLDLSRNTPEAVRVKLADRLDNTLDLRIDIEDPLQGIDFFEGIFQMMFINTYRGTRPGMPHARSAPPLNGSQRLFQLFKNIVLMTLVRKRRSALDDPAVKNLFNALAMAGMKEAQRIAVHIFSYHLTDISVQRKLVFDAMQYVQKGGIDSVTSPGTGSRLDGLFISRFDDPVKKQRNQKLDDLYHDKALMVEAAIAFIVIFLSFLNDPDFYVKGVSEQGIQPGSPEGQAGGPWPTPSS